jgi:hypothetical protein
MSNYHEELTGAIKGMSRQELEVIAIGFATLCDTREVMVATQEEIIKTLEELLRMHGYELTNTPILGIH